MGNLNIYYDEEGDFLEITNGELSNCYFDNLGNGIFQIIEKETKEVKGIAIHNFKKRSEGMEDIRVNLPFKITKVN